MRERHTLPAVVDRLVDEGCEQVFCELAPGDAVLFHSELLHQSHPNATEKPRWAFLCAYDTMHNGPNWGEDWRRPTSAWDDASILPAAAEHLARLLAAQA